MNDLHVSFEQNLMTDPTPERLIEFDPEELCKP